MRLYLHAYTINGQPVGVSTKNWSDTELNNNPAFIATANTSESGYTNISSIENWHTFGDKVLRDYQEIRLAMRLEMYDKGWDNCTNAEKELCMVYYCNPDQGGNVQNTQMITYLMTTKGLTLNQAKFAIVDYWFNHWDKFVQYCPERWRRAAKQTVLYLNFADATDLDNKLQNLKVAYFMTGVLGLAYGDHHSGIMDFVESTNDYVGNGLADQGYTLSFGTWNDFKTAITNELAGQYFWPEIKTHLDNMS